jgi:hypothetical protein
MFRFGHEVMTTTNVVCPQFFPLDYSRLMGVPDYSRLFLSARVYTLSLESVRGWYKVVDLAFT